MTAGRKIRHIWLVEHDGPPSQLALFLQNFSRSFDGDAGAWANQVLAAAHHSFQDLVVVVSDCPSRLQALCDAIAKNPQRLAHASNILGIVAPYAPTLAAGELHAAAITVKD